jgi:hypothetical protein
MEYALTIHCMLFFWMFKSLPVYGIEIAKVGPSAMFTIMELVHAATIQTDT